MWKISNMEALDFNRYGISFEIASNELDYFKIKPLVLSSLIKNKRREQVLRDIVEGYSAFIVTKEKLFFNCSDGVVYLVWGQKAFLVPSDMCPAEVRWRDNAVEFSYKIAAEEANRLTALFEKREESYFLKGPLTLAQIPADYQNWEYVDMGWCALWHRQNVFVIKTKTDEDKPEKGGRNGTNFSGKNFK